MLAAEVPALTVAGGSQSSDQLRSSEHVETAVLPTGEGLLEKR